MLVASAIMRDKSQAAAAPAVPTTTAIPTSRRTRGSVLKSRKRSPPCGSAPCPEPSLEPSPAPSPASAAEFDWPRAPRAGEASLVMQKIRVGREPALYIALRYDLKTSFA